MMRAKDYHRFNQSFTVAQAVAYESGDKWGEGGIAESARAAAESAGKMLGKIVEALVDKGVFTEQEIGDLIGWEVSE